MEKKIEKQLKKLGGLLKSEPQEKLLSEDQILAFVEDQLNGDDLQKVEKIIVQNPQFCEEIFALRKIVSERPKQQPSKELHEAVLKNLNLSKSYLMEIVINISKEVISVLKGDNFIPDNLAPVSASRGIKDSLIVFRSEVSPYFVSCQIHPKDDKQLIHFSLENDEGEKLRNGRFIIKQNDNKILEVITDKTGSTERKDIHFGEYEVEISIGKEILGAIKISISK
ncbi:MAG: hypothetical protein ISR90_05690 [Candidatus Marinimicrobia bacterium]|nr:hypothetical protein [Candidatus Neomarinimicrobiota bacterium]MBL7023525.1 hypothetical protein [Candidatus Neomarinimicrobiota bacterium]MBL7109427.1 hypothetical protein [Candidatus Neomarinimicrobiota bacterium]